MTNTIRGLMNNFTTTLTNNITNSATTFDLVSVTGLATALASCDFVPMTIDDGSNIEIIHVTGLSTNTVTCVRGQEGTSGTAFSAGAAIEVRATADAISKAPYWQPIKVIVTSGTQAEVKFEGLTDGDYRIDIVKAQCTTGSDDLAIRQGTGGTPTYQNTSYYYDGASFIYSAGDQGNRGSNQAQIKLMVGMSNNSAIFASGFVEIRDVDTAATKKPIRYECYQEISATFNIGMGSRDVAEAVTALKFFFVGGDTFVNGSKFILSKRVY
jgi:hypothetical protein